MLHRPMEDSMKVLIVEDAPEVQRSLMSMFAFAAGVQVIGCAADVSGAVAMIDAQRPDVVLLDVSLRGGERGYDVLRHVRREHPKTRVVVLSNFTWSEMREGFIDGGACAYFDKSFEFQKARDWIVRQAAA
jgi:DNA-binding NarL/FixJ family response regulator